LNKPSIYPQAAYSPSRGKDHDYQQARILDEGIKRYLMECVSRTKLPGGRHAEAGEYVLIPKYYIRFTDTPNPTTGIQPAVLELYDALLHGKQARPEVLAKAGLEASPHHVKALQNEITQERVGLLQLNTAFGNKEAIKALIAPFGTGLGFGSAFNRLLSIAQASCSHCVQ
jgi:hypothetical protein